MQIYQVDAFTCEPFHGNPAAVCLLDGLRREVWMLCMAQECFSASGGEHSLCKNKKPI